MRRPPMPFGMKNTLKPPRVCTSRLSAVNVNALCEPKRANVPSENSNSTMELPPVLIDVLPLDHILHLGGPFRSIRGLIAHLVLEAQLTVALSKAVGEPLAAGSSGKVIRAATKKNEPRHRFMRGSRVLNPVAIIAWLRSQH